MRMGTFLSSLAVFFCVGALGAEEEVEGPRLLVAGTLRGVADGQDDSQEKEPQQPPALLELPALVAEHFPAETRTSRPVGGSVLWLELPAKVNAERLFDDAIAAGISIAPGPIFSPCLCYTNFIRLIFGHPWNEKTEAAIRWLGQRVAQL